MNSFSFPSCSNVKLYHHLIFILIFLSFLISVESWSPAQCHADQLEDAMEEIVQDFERHILRTGTDKKYYVVVRSFVDKKSGKAKTICEEIEDILSDVVIEKFSHNKNIIVLNRKRIEAIEREVHFETNEIHFQPDAWQKKLGKKLGAGFLITGTTRKLQSRLKVRAQMIDIVTGEVLAGSSAKVSLSEIDEDLLEDYGTSKTGEKKIKERKPTPIVHSGGYEKNGKSYVAPTPVDAIINTHNTARPLGNGRYDWTVYISSDNGTLTRIQCVEYTLHPTFPNPVRMSCTRNNNFSLSSNGWGTFNIKIRVIFKDGSQKNLSHMLKF